jgi:hypothetical protein
MRRATSTFVPLKDHEFVIAMVMNLAGGVGVSFFETKCANIFCKPADW